MKIYEDDLKRIVLADDYKERGTLIFDVTGERVNIYQDSENQTVRTAFESIDESVEMSKNDLIKGLQEIVSILKERY
ncbi:hypothetical protein [Enterococcus sp. AZ102]|uniref:hypothetical protein n=1 Tax=Enterococcus sp. AZ102 TaxID=2774865 RepID=UPI003F219CAC